MEKSTKYAKAVGHKVFVDGKLEKYFCPLEDDYAYTNARKWANEYNSELKNSEEWNPN